MKTLILGGGGREHAVAQAILKSEKCKKVFILPGNAGTEKIGENIAGDINDFEHMIFCKGIPPPKHPQIVTFIKGFGGVAWHGRGQGVTFQNPMFSTGFLKGF